MPLLRVHGQSWESVALLQLQKEKLLFYSRVHQHSKSHE